MESERVQDLIDRALVGYAELTSLGEDVEDEWSYVNDLAAAWTMRLEAVADARGSEVVHPAVSVALDRALEEVSLIADPHRAIDWLSTFPQVLLVALGEAP